MDQWEASTEFDFGQLAVSGLTIDGVGGPQTSTLIEFDDTRAYVVTGAQFGLAQVHLQLADGAPHLAEAWDQAVEVSVECREGLVQVGATTEEPDLSVSIPPGPYRVRVQARRSRAEEALSLDEPVEPNVHVLIALWRSPWLPAVVLRGNGADSESALEAARPPASQSRGVVAANEIYRWLHDQGRQVELEPSETARAHRRIKASVDEIFDFIHTSTWTCMGGETTANGYLYDCWNPDDHPEHRYLGRFGEVRGEWIEVDHPRRLSCSWAWFLPPEVTDELQYSHSELRLLEGVDSRVTYTLTPAGGSARTFDIAVEHVRLPAALATPMSAVWQLNLDRLRQSGD